ncbi:MAG: hypothetical protein ACMUIP_14995, partial [bacterium]
IFELNFFLNLLQPLVYLIYFFMRQTWAVDCDDGVGCTEDTCNEATDSCDNTPNDALCSNGLYCDGAESCDPELDCQAGIAVNCNDGIGCTDDTCNEATDSCDNTPNDAICSNGLYCDGAETCDPALDCQDGSDPCPGQMCQEDSDNCVDCINDSDCDDGLYCNGTETCVGGVCQAGTAVDCSDGVGCTDDSCNEATDACDNAWPACGIEDNCCGPACDNTNDPDCAVETDTVTITKAEFNVGRSELKVEATSSYGGSVTLTITGYGDMTYDSRKDIFKFKEKGVPDPGATITVTSSGGGEDTASVTRK